MHSQLAGCPALVSIVFLQHGEDKSLFEFAYRLRVQNIAFVHLQDECFELISHGIPLSLEKLLLSQLRFSLFARFRFGRRSREFTCVAPHGAASRVPDKSGPAILKAPTK